MWLKYGFVQKGGNSQKIWDPSYRRICNSTQYVPIIYMVSILFHEIRLGGFRKVAMAIFWSNFKFQTGIIKMPDGRVKKNLCNSLR